LCAFQPPFQQLHPVVNTAAKSGIQPFETSDEICLIGHYHLCRSRWGWCPEIRNEVGYSEVDLMADAGCKSLFIGFESMNENNLASYNKKQNKRRLYEALIGKVHQRDMMVNASIVFGFDHDTPDVFEGTVNWLIDRKVETMTAHILTPYPGTRLFARLHKEKRIMDYNFDHYNTSYAVFKPRRMTPGELEFGYKMAYKKFYSTRSIFSRLPSSSSRRVPFLLFNFFYRKWGRFFSTLGKFGVMMHIGHMGKRLCYGNLSSPSKSTMTNVLSFDANYLSKLVSLVFDNIRKKLVPIIDGEK